MPVNSCRKHMSIFMSFSGDGGVERMMANLAQGMLDAGYQVDFLLARAQGKHLSSIPEGVRLVKLGKQHTFEALPGLIAYLKRERPAAMLAAKDRAIKVAIIARFLARSDTFLAGRIGTTVSTSLKDSFFLKRLVWYLGMRLFYRFTDLIIAVSEGVADDIRKVTSLPLDKVIVIHNPVVTPALMKLASEPVSHPWFLEPQIPLIMGMGRLTTQKDFTTLIKAFAIVRDVMECRLIIFGEGQKRPDLEKIVRDLKLEKDIALPGFSPNPYSGLARSSLFVLSSRWEGSPNALTEALALGRPVVSTDCRSGPREILQDGRYGDLVPVGNENELAKAMIRTLNNPKPAAFLRKAAEQYTVHESVKGYLETLGLEDPSGGP